METITHGHFFHRLFHLLRSLSLLVLTSAARLLSPVVLKELFLSLLLLICGLAPRTLAVGSGSGEGGATFLHLWCPRRRSWRRPALVLIHGFGGFAKWQFERQIATLSRSFDLYIPDLVFFGRSSSSEEERSVEFQARCVAAAMRLLGVDRYSVAGISYGGFVAFRMAAEEAAVEVERVVIMASGITATTEMMEEMAGKEKREITDLLLPQREEDLRTLFRRCMYRPPSWMPDFLLRDFIKV